VRDAEGWKVQDRESEKTLGAGRDFLKKRRLLLGAATDNFCGILLSESQGRKREFQKKNRS